MRLFFAFGLPPHIVSSIAALQSQLQTKLDVKGLRWSKPESIHLTLKFIGESDSAMLPQFERAAASAVDGVGPLTLEVGDLGAFPSPRKPRVLWLGLREPTGGLQRMAADLETELAALGVPPEDRPFSPHLTLARLKRGAPRAASLAVQQLFDGPQLTQVGTFEVISLVLYESKLRPQGAIYHSLAAIPLGAA